MPVDTEVYNLQGTPPQPLPPVPPAPPPPPFSNDQVIYLGGCTGGAVLTYSGTLPNWITLDAVNGTIIGAAGTYRGNTKAQANATAQSALNSFAAAAVASGALTCATGPDWTQLFWTALNNCTGASSATITPDSATGDTAQLNTQSPNGSIFDAADAENTGVMMYNGPLTNCKATLTMVTGGDTPFILANILISFDFVLIASYSTLAPPGSHVLNFTIPDSGGVAKQISVFVQNAIGNGFPPPDPANMDMTVKLENV